MAGRNVSCVKAELRDKLVYYHQEAAVVLWMAFKPQILTDQPAIEPADDQVIQQFQQIVELQSGRMAHQREQPCIEGPGCKLTAVH